MTTMGSYLDAVVYESPCYETNQSPAGACVRPAAAVVCSAAENSDDAHAGSRPAGKDLVCDCCRIKTVASGVFGRCVSFFAKSTNSPQKASNAPSKN
ncbi:hypothetical protein L596_003708 [Steinernema carpocapsae]|uniref:Uncharacterized protein n=1 Tax=Steinernema carpocapsae TaxID=34508 RepID=A0A4U8UV21_STECR|nr:hypothetical protein L596_003708 [Steinernema carpocapsae]